MFAVGPVFVKVCAREPREDEMETKLLLFTSLV